MDRRKLLERISRGYVQNVSFRDFLGLAVVFGFRLDRIRGSHHILVHPAVPVPLNLQDFGGEAKPYQVRHFRRIVMLYNLRMEGDA